MQQQHLSNCVFCQLFVKDSKPRGGDVIEYEDDELIVIRDQYPKSDLHLLAIPKQHIATTSDLTEDNLNILQELETKIIQVAKKCGYDPMDTIIGYHKWPFIHVKHLHLHLISPYSKVGTIPKLFFKYNSVFFISSNDMIESVQNKNNEKKR